LDLLISFGKAAYFFGPPVDNL